jgi:hydroxyacylglutathione hydrolase
MSTDIKVINLGGVNCYLFTSADQFLLVDSGFSNKRSQLVKELGEAGVRPDNLSLIILTHGDNDHAANAAFLRDKFNAKIAMHREDAGMVQQGDMGAGRKPRPDKISLIGVLVILLGNLTTLFNQSPFEKFTPDLYLEDGQSLADYGLDARVVHIPGHSRGSIGILTSTGDLICGDLLWNMRKPDLHFLVDDLAAHKTSVYKLDGLHVQTVYPGHGSPFRWSDFHHG